MLAQMLCPPGPHVVIAPQFRESLFAGWRLMFSHFGG